VFELFFIRISNSYSNFVLSSDFGVPLLDKNELDHRRSVLDDENETNEKDVCEDDEKNRKKFKTIHNKEDNLKCWFHFYKLFQNSIETFNSSLHENENKIDFSLPIVLCSFSKGCIVINQLCNELVDLCELKDENLLAKEADFEALFTFAKQIRHVMWLDGGHSGSSNSWITKESVIDLIKHLNWSCYVYVTPYQVKSNKVWAVEEYNTFLDLLAKFEVKNKHKYYFDDKEDDYDIEIHFEILNEFEALLV
jgi:hypothetical protein